MSDVVTWWPARRRLARLAIASAFLTGVLVAVVGGGGTHVVRAGLHLVVAVGALRIAALVTGQVVVGMLTIAVVLVGGEAGTALALAPAVAGVIVTAELLAAVARLDTPLERGADGVVVRALSSGALSGLLFAAVASVGGVVALDGSTGLLVASGAVLLLGLLLLRVARSP